MTKKLSDEEFDMDDFMDSIESVTSVEKDGSSITVRQFAKKGVDYEEVQEDLEYGELCQYTRRGSGYMASWETVEELEPNVYKIIPTQEGILYSPQEVVTDDLLRLPDTKSDEVVKEIERFWTLKETFNKFGYSHKRGFLLYGPPGSGKSSTLNIVSKQLVDNGGVVFLGDCTPGTLAVALKQFREVEPARPAIVILEDIDTLIQQHGESDVLSILDGENSIDNVCHIATCYSPDVRMLTSDLQWIPCGDLKVGDELWAFDENKPNGRGARRRYKRSRVTYSSPAKKECVKIYLNTGESFVCTTDHPWLSFGDVQTKTFRLDWTLAKDLMKYPNLVRPFEPWKTETSWEAGWLAGILDGEGCVCKGGTAGRASNVTVAQNFGLTADKIAAAMNKRVKTHFYERNTRKGMMVIDTVGGVAATAKLIGQTRAERLINQFDLTGCMMKNTFPARVVRIEFIGVKEIQSIQMSGGTYIAEGFAAHNTNYPESLDPRVVNRPSRFDRVVKIDLPTAEARKVYLETRKLGLNEKELEDWIKKTEGFSIAHLKEVIVSVMCFGNNFEQEVKRVKAMAKTPSSSGDRKSGFGA